jgi:putative transposase
MFMPFFHCLFLPIINYCIEHNIGTIIIGKNKQWKNGINLGTKTPKHGGTKTLRH